MRNNNKYNNKRRRGGDDLTFELHSKLNSRSSQLTYVGPWMNNFDSRNHEFLRLVEDFGRCRRINDLALYTCWVIICWPSQQLDGSLLAQERVRLR